MYLGLAGLIGSTVPGPLRRESIGAGRNKLKRSIVHRDLLRASMSRFCRAVRAHLEMIASIIICDKTTNKFQNRGIQEST